MTSKEYIHKIEYYKNGINVFSLVQEIFRENEVLFDNIDLNAYTVYVHNMEAKIFITSKGKLNICWTDDQYVYTIMCETDEYNVVKLAESVQ